MFKAVAVAALVFATGAPAFAQPRPFYGLPATPAEEQAQELRDQAACTELGADQGRINDYFYAAPRSGGIGGAILVGLVTGVMTGMAEISRTEHAIRRCMDDRGYEALTLAPEKTAELKALKSRAQRTEWFARTPLFGAVQGSPLHTVSMGAPTDGAETWDPEFNRPVILSRDPVTGETVKTFLVHP